MTPEPAQAVEHSPGFVAFAKRFCINPAFDGGRYYKKRRGWVLIDLATRTETSFKTLRDAKRQLMRLYTDGTSKNIATAGADAPVMIP